MGKSIFHWIRLMSAVVFLAGCATYAERAVWAEEKAPYKDPAAKVEERISDLLSRMILEEKIGQMAQVEKNSLYGDEISGDMIGSVLSGGGASPAANNPESWADMTDGFQKKALRTRLAIPLLYGADAVHGHNNVRGAVIFPHNIGLGAAGDAELMREIGRVTAEEMAATGVFWNFAPTVAVPQDIRWGRTYEGYSENPELVGRLAAAYIEGLQNTGTEGFGAPGTVLATPKHYVGDGGTEWGAAAGSRFMIDQGVNTVDEAVLRRIHLPPYLAAIKAGARSIMVSFSSWRDIKMHGHKYLLTDVLKGELKFSGFLISDWQAIDQLPGDYYSDVVVSINAGLDMIMTPKDSRTFCQTLKKAVENNDVPLERIDDAVRRILKVKFELGLFERPFAVRELLDAVGSPEHRALARESVQKSLVLLKNDGALPLSRNLTTLLAAGAAADDIGMQCGGWTIDWQGGRGDITPGTSIVFGLRGILKNSSALRYEKKAEFEPVKGKDGRVKKAAVGIAVVGEAPYAEGIGDSRDLSLLSADTEMVQRLRPQCEKLIVVIVSGRPLIITDILPLADAVVAAWLPGTEGVGVADVLFGDVPFTGKLPYRWPRSMADVPEAKGRGVLFPYGYGLEYSVKKK